MTDDSNHLLKVFLCHASSDKAEVLNLYSRLTSDGIDAWLDKEKLIPGQNWQIEIPKAVRNTDVVIVCLSAQSVNKDGFVQKEIKIALDAADEKPEGTIFIIPARLENCDVPERISQFHWVDLFSEDGYERLLKALQIRAGSLNKIIKPIVKKKSISHPNKIVHPVESSRFVEKKSKTETTGVANDAVLKRIVELENYKERLKKSVTNSTLAALAIGIFVVFSSISVSIAGIMSEYSLFPFDSDTIAVSLVIAFFLTFITFPILYNNSKRKDKEALERTNKNIQELRNKIKSEK